MILTIAIVLALAVAAAADDFFEKFKDDYNTLSQDLLNNTGEVAAVSNFTYTKDVATFTLKEGKVHFQRYVNDRPTTAIFIGSGSVTIDVPTHAGRQGLWAVSKDSTVSENFEILFIRMADDFDLKLKEQFTFEQEELDWRQLTQVKGSAQGEFFFKPNIEHPYDNYFRLLASCYERGPDGFFFADFNRYCFTYDPNWPEQVCIGYEFEGGDLVPTVAARFQRRENNAYDDTLLSLIPYRTTVLNKEATVHLSGQDGRRIDHCRSDIDLLINADSIRYLSFYLQFNLNIDSLHADGRKVDFMRRRSFQYTGVILPEYRHKGDTVSLSVFYEGTNYDHFIPTVANPAAAPYRVTFVIDKANSGYNYFTTAMGAAEKTPDGDTRFVAAPPVPFNEFFFHCYASGVDDTVEVISDIGLTLNYVLVDGYQKRKPCYISEDRYQDAVTAAFNFFAARFSQPPFTFAEYVIPEGFQSMPGMIKVPQVACVTEGDWQAVGAFDNIAGNGVSRQWFGAMMRPRSDREQWLRDALPPFMSLLFIENHRSSDQYFSNLSVRRDSLYTQLDMGQEMPLAAGERVNAYSDENRRSDYYRTIMANKGVWVLHMLRFLMYDYDTGSEAAFNGFLRELYLTVNNKTYSNADIAALAAKHYGQPLDWFFQKWLYGAYLPKFDVSWQAVQRDGAWYLPVAVTTNMVTPAFRMPVVVRMVKADGSNYFDRLDIRGTRSDFELGPFEQKPNDFIFNEFMSVLGYQSVTAR